MQELNFEQQYLKELLDKYNADENDPELDVVTKLLLSQLKLAQRTISEKTREVDVLNTEIKERQEKGNGLVQQIVMKQGESQGYLNALLKLRKT